MSVGVASSLRWITVNCLNLASPPEYQDRLVAFAIDEPRVGDRLPGTGLELNGWAIGRDGPLRGIRTVVNSSSGPACPLNVRRPDVAADYPSVPHAAESGFSNWVPIDGDEGEPWRLRVEAVLADGSNLTLAEVGGTLHVIGQEPEPGHRITTGPDFVIIGAQRGGTTSLHAYLSAHPNVVMPSTKELHYLTNRFQRGRDWYVGQFPREMPAGALTGEATPYALFHPSAPGRLRAVAPAAKLIVLLRNPVERAYSHYLLERRRGDELLSFAEALDAEPERLAGEEARLLADPRYVSHSHNHASYLARGLYAPQLARWLEVFPREQILILRSEDFYRHTAGSFARVLDFLQLPTSEGIPFVAHNQGGGPSLDATLRNRLMSYFSPPNRDLSRLLGWDPAWE